MDIVQRHLAARVERALGTSRVVNIVGPRQAGKTTLVRNLIETAFYATLDDDAVRSALEADAYGQLHLLSDQAKSSGRPIVLDEVQRVPEITFALKRIVDADRRPGQFVLTGSSDIFTTGAAYDSLAGRVLTLTLRPFSAAEIAGAGPCGLLDAVSSHPADCLDVLPKPCSFTRRQAIDLIVRGGFPEIRALPDPDRMDRYRSYLDSIVERDVAPVAHVRKPDMLRRLIDQMAARTAEEINVAALCQVLGARKETVNDYIDILSRLGIVHRLGAWTSSGAKREIKAPKLHFLDTGCATALRGEDSGSFGLGADPTALGHLLETFVFTELEKSLAFLSKRWRLYHWRLDSREIDIVAEAPGKLLALFEMKAASTVDVQDFRHIDWFRSEGPGRDYHAAGFVIYLGSQLLSFGPGRIAVPLSMLWSFEK
ncbi:ATP-binding protein [Azovibrio restrictus]|uniref:ATP-binding protein n=1 Tax=Azovibrio restrictus TaxID=146938 RepID=UPI0026F074E1|nr:ATP-binding protein [Azovibrio restrictus]